MKKILLILIFLLGSSNVGANCTAEITNVLQDASRGSIIVETKYTLNGFVIQQGKTRYLETSGTNTEIIARAKSDINAHCENLIRRIPANRNYLSSNKLKQQKTLTQPIINSIKSSLVGFKLITTEVTDTFKGKDIKVTYDSKNTVIDAP